ncbi:MAG: hypothetical protein H0W68_05120 [Gemmatimonadaceae bacterium]|nr:hypothetical protein [Gemmatimonadaceae bacterium]
MLRIVAVGALAFLSFTPAVHAQIGELQPGVRVRLSAPGAVAEGYEGTLISRTADTLVVAGGKVAPVRVPVSAITGLELDRGKSHGKGALRGLACIVLGATVSRDLVKCSNGLITTGGQCGRLTDIRLRPTRSGISLVVEM